MLFDRGSPSLCSSLRGLSMYTILPFNSELIVLTTDYGHTKATSLILCSPISNPNPKYMGRGYKGYRNVEIMVEYWETWTKDSLYQNGC